MHKEVLLSVTNNCVTGNMLVGHRPHRSGFLRSMSPIYLCFRRRKNQAIKFQIQNFTFMSLDNRMSLEDFKRKHSYIYAALEKELMVLYLKEEIE